MRYYDEIWWWWYYDEGFSYKKVVIFLILLRSYEFRYVLNKIQTPFWRSESSALVFNVTSSFHAAKSQAARYQAVFWYVWKPRSALFWLRKMWVSSATVADLTPIFADYRLSPIAVIAQAVRMGSIGHCLTDKCGCGFSKSRVHELVVSSPDPHETNELEL